MSPLLRGGLAVAGLTGAFAAGFLLKPGPAARTVAAQAPPAGTHVAAKPAARPAPEVDVPVIRPPAPGPAPEIRIPDIAPPPAVDPAVKPATELGTPQAARPELADPLDAAGMAMIGKAMGIKTTIRDKNEPVPAVLAQAGKDPAPPIPRADIDLPPPGPVPMGGPMPRLDPPPTPAIPTVGDNALVIPPPQGSVPTPARPVPLVNTRAVALDFEVTRSGPSKVTAVELWTTRDGGATWAKTDRMAGCVSPFRTRLGSDGEYGFRLVMESESGMRTPEPRPKDPPDLRLVLDATPPAIVLFPLNAVPESPGKVRFHWHMTDVHPDREYVRLEYSEDGNQWHAIHHVGRTVDSCYWVPPAGLPPRVMIRVTGRDRAGNYTTVTVADKVAIDLVAPAGKVTGVRGSEPEVGPMPRQVEAGADRGSPFPGPLRGLLPALLASPSLFPPLVPEHTAVRRLPCGVTRSDDVAASRGGCVVGPRSSAASPNLSAREWVERLTNTTVVEEPALPPFARRDPFAPPAVTRELPAWVFSHAQRPDGEGLRAACERPLVPSLHHRLAEQLRPFWETAGYTGGRSLIHHLADPDWKPTTATPDSCRWEPGPRGPRSPFDGAIDVVIPPDRPSAPTVARGR